jgi:hypothetical protein
MKKKYEAPRILTTETLTARAVACASGDDTCRQQGGPLNS